MRIAGSIALLLVAGILASSPASASLQGAGAVVRVVTDTGSWSSSGTTVDDITTSFAIAGNRIRLSTLTDAYISEVTPPASPCDVAIQPNDDPVVHLSCTIHRQRVFYTLTTPTFQQLGNALVSQTNHFAGYASVGFSGDAPITYIAAMKRNGADLYRNTSPPSANPSTFVFAGPQRTNDVCITGDFFEWFTYLVTNDGFQSPVTFPAYHSYTCL